MSPLLTLRRRSHVDLLALTALSAFLAAVRATPPRTISRRGADVLLGTPLIDAHNDLPKNLRELVKNKLQNFDFRANLSVDPVWNCSTCFTDLPRLRAGRVGAQFWVAFVPCTAQYKDALQMTLEQIDVIKRLTDVYSSDLEFVTSAQGIEDSFKRGKIASLIGVEGGHSIDSRMGVLRLLYEAGTRYLTLTHSCNTPWADSSGEDNLPQPQNGGLSAFGERIVLEMNRLGMMVDLSHVSDPTMRDALRVSLAPVIFSHSSARALCPHHRNVPDDVLRSVAANGGLVMVNFYSRYVVCEEREATLEDVVEHINHVRQVAGVDHVGLGANYDGAEEYPRGLQDVSAYPALFDRLAEGRATEPQWADDDLRKLAGRNLLRVLRDAERVRDELRAKGVGPDEEWLPGTRAPSPRLFK